MNRGEKIGLPLGKISPDILERTVFLHLGKKRRDVIVAPAEGEDSAIIRVEDKILALHCDPISGSHSNIGWIAMNIATNDIATRGVKPLWALSCIMLPKGSTEEILDNICRDIGRAAEKLGISVIGGHSEITLGLDHPLVIITALGVAENARYVTTSDATPGSKIILTKSIGIEGTAILASDRKNQLSEEFGERFVKRATAYFDKLSIMQEALIAFNYNGVLAMHDPTEGGLAGGLNEMANASKTGFKVYENTIDIKNETLEICRFFKIDPLALISSGALLIVARPEKAEGMLTHLKKKGIEAALIGEILEDETYRKIVRTNGREETLDMPASDELWKALVPE